MPLRNLQQCKMYVLQLKTKGRLYVKPGKFVVIGNTNILYFCIYWLPPLVTMEIASMQTVSLDILKHGYTQTHRQTGRLRDRKDRITEYCQLKTYHTHKGIRTVVNALSVPNNRKVTVC